MEVFDEIFMLFGGDEGGDSGKKFEDKRNLEVKHKTKTKPTYKTKHGIGSKSWKLSRWRPKITKKHSFLVLKLGGTFTILYFHSVTVLTFRHILKKLSSLSVSWRAKGQNIRHNPDPSEVKEDSNETCFTIDMEYLGQSLVKKKAYFQSSQPWVQSAESKYSLDGTDLVIKNMQRDDEGSYLCKVRRWFWSYLGNPPQNEAFHHSPQQQPLFQFLLSRRDSVTTVT